MQLRHFTVFFIFLEHILYSSNALILIKFGKVYEHYTKHGESSTTHDPLGDFGLEERIQLCDEVLHAKQFSTKYPPWYVKRISTQQRINFTKWGLPPDVPIDTLNYQRTISLGQGGKNSPAPHYYGYRHRGRGITQAISIQIIQCVRTATLSWFITSGRVNGMMYLLESDDEKANSRLRFKGILEPGPILDHPGFEYFESQHGKYKDEMESICLLGLDDHMRLCSVVLEALDKLGRLTKTIGQNIHVKHRRRRCGLRDINMNGRVSQEYFLHCDFAFEDGSESSSLFYTLPDSSERGAVFVFLEGESGRLELYARMVKIGALLYPFGPREIKLSVGAQFRNEEEEIIRNNDFVSWRELQELKQVKERSRYHSPRPSQPKLKSEITRHSTPSKVEREVEDETTNQEERRRRKRKGKWSKKAGDKPVTKSEDELGHALQRSEDGTRRKQNGHKVTNEDSIEKSASKKPKKKSEESECRRDGLEKVSDSSEEEDEQASNDKTTVNRRYSKLLELERVARMFAGYFETDFTDKSGAPTSSKNLPQS